MKRLLFTMVATLALMGCADDSHSDAELGDGPDTETGIETNDGSNDEMTDEESGTEDENSGADTTEDETTESDGTEETSDTGSEPETNPGPGEPCNPLLAFDGAAPCEYPEGEDGPPLTCALVLTNGGIPMRLRCAVLSDSQGDGNDLQDKCELPPAHDGSAYPCLNTHCMGNNTNPADPSLGEWAFPPGFCNGVAAGEYSPCCTMYCDPETPGQPCGAGMKCFAFNPATLEEGTMPLGYCVDSAYSGG
ncbi:MAG: hypothetical protein JSV19_01015 [Phycisphaerales bacterium]|nr:MAG: hypothetical protein JSV19_01015 [Phycisphaerales bacterium]